MRIGNGLMGAILGACCFVAGCSDTVTGPGSGSLHIYVEQVNCAGTVSNVRISIDGVFEGIGQPGDSGVTINVGVGNHAVSAVSAEGIAWGPTTVTVNAGETTNAPLRCSN